MTKLTPKQIEQVKNIEIWMDKNFHGNTKKVGHLPLAAFKEIVYKKKVREGYKANNSKKTDLQRLRDLIKWSLECANTNYFKVLIEGNTSIYYASPIYGHSDYNKARVFKKTPTTLNFIRIFNGIVNKNNYPHIQA